MPRTASRSRSPARFHHAYTPAKISKARIHAASKKSQGTCEVAPYHSRTSHSAATPDTRQVGLSRLSSALSQRRNRQRGQDLAQHVGGPTPAAHAKAMGEHR